jgi:hypothetical protein
MAETQDSVRESQSQLQSANPNKRRIDHSIDTAAQTKTKRFRAATQPSFSQLRMVDVIVHTLDSSESSELSVLDLTPRIDGETIAAKPDNNPTQLGTTDEMVAQEEAQAPRNAKPPAVRQKALIEDVDGIDLASIFDDEEAEEGLDTLLGDFTVDVSSEEEDYVNEEKYEDEDDEYEDET